MWTRLIFFHKKHEKSTVNTKSVIKGSYKANGGAGAETFWKSEPERERKQKVSAPQHWDLAIFTSSIMFQSSHVLTEKKFALTSSLALGFTTFMSPAGLSRSHWRSRCHFEPASSVHIIFAGTVLLLYTCSISAWCLLLSSTFSSLVRSWNQGILFPLNWTGFPRFPSCTIITTVNYFHQASVPRWDSVLLFHRLRHTSALNFLIWAWLITVELLSISAASCSDSWRMYSTVVYFLAEFEIIFLFH